MATTGGQTINDRINAVRYALVGQGLARTVCKATTEEVLGPKKKHIDYLLACTNEPNVSIPQMANLLIERSQHSSWAVVFKSLTTIHHLMSFGNERFSQFLATSNHSFELNDFMDRATPQGYNMSTFVRNYSKYINDKIISYRTLALDLCKIKSGNDNVLRTMNMDNLSKTLPIVHKQFDSLLEFNADVKDLNNGIIMSAFRLLYKDLVRLYVAYQEAIINLLERYFKLSRKKTREALEMYKKYLNRMDKVEEFLKIVDQVDLDKSEMPDLTKSPASILKLLEQHLVQLEAKKQGTTPISPTNEDDEQEAKKQQSAPAPADSTTSTAATSSSSKEELTEKNKIESAKVDQQETTTTTTTVKKDSKPEAAKGPPQKPARPSPIASPKTSAPKEEQQKKPPPERPAKPPSRPPPPPADKQAKSPTTPSKETSPKDKPAPPPHPPPPAHSTPAPTPPPPAAPEAASEEAESAKPEVAETKASEEQTERAVSAEDGQSHQVDGQEEPPHAPEDDSVDHKATCSTNAAATTEQVGETSESLNANHLDTETNNGHAEEAQDQAAGDEEEMPAPPPPIEEDQVAPPNPEEPAEGANEEPALVNGGSGINGELADANNEPAVEADAIPEDNNN